jgi:hypothetical protein
MLSLSAARETSHKQVFARHLTEPFIGFCAPMLHTYWLTGGLGEDFPNFTIKEIMRQRSEPEQPQHLMTELE